VVDNPAFAKLLKEATNSGAMPVRIENQTFSNNTLIGSGKTYSGIELVGVTLLSCCVAQFDDPGFGLVVRDALLRKCRLRGCAAQQVYFEEVTLENLTGNLLYLYACVFSHVTLKGNIGPILTVPPHNGLADRDRFVTGMVEKYKKVDWALDISEATLSDADFYYVPGDLIRYDPATQVLLRRAKFSGIDRDELPRSAKIWTSRFEATPFDSLVATAPKRSKHFAEYMRAIEWLHKRNLAG
jgi:uncharacterized protein YjbI with pentapeptide repeats